MARWDQARSTKASKYISRSLYPGMQESKKRKNKEIGKEENKERSKKFAKIFAINNQ